MDGPPACSCGATLAPDAGWCPRCLAPRAAGTGSGEPMATGHRAFDPRAASAAASAAPVTLASARTTARFAKTDVSFGLTGRVVMTVLLLIPFAWFVYLAQWMIAIGGLVIYAVIFLPMALRDVWRSPRRR